MNVQVIACEVRSLGDAMRELDGKGWLRGDFILTSFDTITNAKLIPSVMKAHKENCKRDKEAAMTVVYKKIAPGQRTGNEVVIATNKRTKRLLFHHRIHPTVESKESKFKFPLEIFLDNKEVSLHHDLIDPQIAICSTSTLPLFTDNFDYDTRDQFIRGIVMDQELQAATIYVEQLPIDQYAAKISDWNAYHSISQDILNRWVYPLVPDMGVCALKQQYLFLKNNIYRSNSVKVARNCSIKNDVVLHENVDIGDESLLARCVLGKNCTVGKNCKIRNAYIFDNTTISDNCTLTYCIIGSNCIINEGCTITEGSVISNDCEIPSGVIVDGWRIQPLITEEDHFSDDTFEKLSDKAFKIVDGGESARNENSDDDLADKECGGRRSGYIKLSLRTPMYESSAYSSKSNSDDEDNDMGVAQEDSAIFLAEVMDSLKRGFDERSNPDFLILEINSSRYAYNIQLNEVNFFVVKACFSLPTVLEHADALEGFKQVYSYLGEKVIKNYIKGDGAMVDCLNAIEECCEESERLKARLLKTLHFLFNEDILTEDIIISWYEDNDKDWIKTSLKKFIEWLQQDSESDSD
jgi:translation initiation factor eIF-2B subunit epsilon